MIEKIYNHFKNYFIEFCLLLVFIADTATFYHSREFINLSWFIKGVLSVIFLIVLLKKKYQLGLIIIVSFILLLIGLVFNNETNKLKIISLFFEIYSGVLFLNTLIILNLKRSKLLFWIFSFYSFSIVTASLLSIDFFKTYSTRYGYLPFFSSQNEFSFIMMSGIIFFYLSYKNNTSKINLFFLLLSVIASLLVGTKASLLFTLLFLIFICYRKFNKKILLPTISVTVLLLISILLNLVKINFSKFMPVFMRVYNDYGLLAAISSKRTVLFHERWFGNFESFSIGRLLFGGLKTDYLFEMSLIDIPLILGLIGLIIYIYVIKNFYIKVLQIKFKEHFIFFIPPMISLFSGYYFENFSPQFYLTCVFCYFFLDKFDLKNITNLK